MKKLLISLLIGCSLLGVGCWTGDKSPNIIQAKYDLVDEFASKHREAETYETGLTWEQMVNEDTECTLGMFEGEIVQVVHGGVYDSYIVEINGDSGKIIYVEDILGTSKETLVEGDYVHFKGMSLGNTTNIIPVGRSITGPDFVAHLIKKL